MQLLRKNLALIIALVLIVASIGLIVKFVPRKAPPNGTSTVPVATPTGTVTPGAVVASTPLRAGESPSGQPLPEFVGLTSWINTQPLTIADERGKVVIVDFWAYSCVNCLRTVPYLKEWQSKYLGKGLVIIGVHAPEFEFEKDPKNVKLATAKYGITWPVALDNDYATWKAYGNRYWPHKYIADANGNYRYDHIGEGGYREMELLIRQLLTEAGQNVSKIALGSDGDHDALASITPEIYAGSDWGPAGYLGNRSVSGNLGGPQTFADATKHNDGSFYLQGTWQQNFETVQYAAPAGDAQGYLGINYHAVKVNAVLATAGAPAIFEVTHDGVNLPKGLAGEDVVYDKDGKATVTITESRLYNLVAHVDGNPHEVKLYPRSNDFLLFTLTFSPSNA